MLPKLALHDVERICCGRDGQFKHPKTVLRKRNRNEDNDDDDTIVECNPPRRTRACLNDDHSHTFKDGEVEMAFGH